jgi:hypothetical protein
LVFLAPQAVDALAAAVPLFACAVAQDASVIVRDYSVQAPGE